MSNLINLTDKLIQSNILTNKDDQKLYDKVAIYVQDLIKLCLISVSFNAYSIFDADYYRKMRNNDGDIFEDTVATIMSIHGVEIQLAIFKLIKAGIFKLKEKDLVNKLYMTKIFEPLVADELFKIYTRYKLNNK